MKGSAVYQTLRKLFLFAVAVVLLGLPLKADAKTRELCIAPNANFTVDVGDTLSMYCTFTDTTDFDWYIGNNEENALELEGSRSGRRVTFQAVAPGVVTVNCVRTVKTTVQKPYQYYDVYTNEWKTGYNVVTESTNYDCICTITIKDTLAPEITKQPSGEAVSSGQLTGASVEVFDHSEVTYQWFVKTPESPVFKRNGTSRVLLFNMTDALSGLQAYCVITDSAGNSVTSKTITFSQITIRQQPVSVVAEPGKKAVVSVRASGTDLTYTWYVRSAGQPNFTKSSVITASYSYTMTKGKGDRELYCIITDSYGNSVKTNQVTMQMAVYAAITEQPESAAAASGKKVSAKVTAIGDGLAYQWYVKNPGESKFSKSSVTTATYSYTMSANKSGRQVYCIATDQYGTSVKSQTVTFSCLAFTKQPASVGVDDGETATVSCKAEGEGLKYQWYVKNPGSSKFSKSSVNGSTYAIRMNREKSGRKVYCVVTDKYGNTVQSKTVTLKMHIYAAILTEPKSVRVKAGDTATVSVKAEGDGLTYQWYVSSAGVKKYTKSSVTKSSYSLVMSAKNSGRKAYCIITDKYGNTVKSKTVTLNTAAPLEIVTQPVTSYVFEGETATVTVEATGQGTLCYTWYAEKTKDSGFQKISETSNVYSYTMTKERDGGRVYCVVSDNYGQSVRSNFPAIFMIRELTITQQPQDIRKRYSSGTVEFKVMVDGTSPFEFQWYYAFPDYNGVYREDVGTSSNVSRWDTSYSRANGVSVYCVITDTHGQSVTSDVATLSLYW